MTREKTFRVLRITTSAVFGVLCAVSFTHSAHRIALNLSVLCRESEIKGRGVYARNVRTSSFYASVLYTVGRLSCSVRAISLTCVPAL
jgi:hypothetical protein